MVTKDKSLESNGNMEMAAISNENVTVQLDELVLSEPRESSFKVNLNPTI